MYDLVGFKATAEKGASLFFLNFDIFVFCFHVCYIKYLYDMVQLCDLMIFSGYISFYLAISIS